MSCWCVECGTGDSSRWWIVADRQICADCAQTVRDVFALAATLGITGVDLMLAVSE